MNESERKEYLTQFGSRVKELRKSRGMTQLELAVKAGYTDGANPSATISKIEHGQIDVTQSKCADLALALDVEPYELFCDSQTARMIAYAEKMKEIAHDHK